MKYLFICLFSEPSELPEVTNEEPNNSPGATSRNKVSKKRKKSKVMSKVMAVRQQQQTAPTGFEPGQSESPPTRWDLSAQSLLNMTRTFLRHVPEVCKKISYTFAEIST